MNTILITGAGGNLGQELLSVINNESVIALSAKDLDVSNKTEVDILFTKNKPKLVFHFAAKTDVDWCESHNKEASAVNVEGTKNILTACASTGSTLVFPSTYYVYGGISHFPVDDRINEPILDTLQGIYSRTKLLAEYEIINSNYKNYFIARLGSLFGGNQKDKKFVSKILKLSERQYEIDVVTDRFVQPSYTKDTIQNLLALTSTKKFGTYNMVGHGLTSFFNYANAIVKYAKLNISIKPINSDSFSENAPRVQKLEVVNGKLQNIGLDLMRDWKVALKEYLESLNPVL